MNDHQFRIVMNWSDWISFKCYQVEWYAAICLTFYIKNNFKQTHVFDETYT